MRGATGGLGCWLEAWVAGFSRWAGGAGSHLNRDHRSYFNRDLRVRGWAGHRLFQHKFTFLKRTCKLPDTPCSRNRPTLETETEV